MKNKLLNFFKKYWLCVLLSVVIVIGISLSTIYADLYETGSDTSMIRFNLRGLYLIYALPVCAFIYGCVSYIKTKRIWVPQAVLGVLLCIHWLIFDIDARAIAWAGTLIFSVYPVMFSLIGTLITAFICYLVKSSKED